MVMKYANRGNLQNYFNHRKSHNLSPRKKHTFDFKLRHKIFVLEDWRFNPRFLNNLINSIRALFASLLFLQKILMSSTYRK